MGNSEGGGIPGIHAPEIATERVLTSAELLQHTTEHRQNALNDKESQLAKYKAFLSETGHARIREAFGPTPIDSISGYVGLNVDQPTGEGLTIEHGYKKTSLRASIDWSRDNGSRTFHKGFSYSFRSERFLVSNSKITPAPNKPGYIDTSNVIMAVQLVEMDGKYVVARPYKIENGQVNHYTAEWTKGRPRAFNGAPPIYKLRLYSPKEKDGYVLEGNLVEGVKEEYQDLSAALQPGSGFWESEKGELLTKIYEVDRKLLEGFDDSRLGDLVRHIWGEEKLTD